MTKIGYTWEIKHIILMDLNWISFMLLYCVWVNFLRNMFFEIRGYRENKWYISVLLICALYNMGCEIDILRFFKRLTQEAYISLDAVNLEQNSNLKPKRLQFVIFYLFLSKFDRRAQKELLKNTSRTLYFPLKKHTTKR